MWKFSNINDEKRKFRFENKYLLNVMQKENIQNVVEGMFELDKYILKSEGCYRIRSLYFDTYNSKAYRDNEGGVDNREKYRIRIYNCSSKHIILERKIKVNGKISKDRERIDETILNNILEEKFCDINFTNEQPLLNRFLLECQLNYLRPCNIVDYERVAYVDENVDVRITFDRNICFSSDVRRFFDENLSLQPILSVGSELLEVKYVEFIPKYIYQLLDSENLQQSTFSKFYLCEKYRRQGEL